MDDFDHARDPAGEDAPDIRVGHHAIALLHAARASGDPALIAQAEAMALAAGWALAERLRARSDGTDD